jgi:hypothetical protein
MFPVNWSHAVYDHTYLGLDQYIDVLPAETIWPFTVVRGKAPYSGLQCNSMNDGVLPNGQHATMLGLTIVLVRRNCGCLFSADPSHMTTDSSPKSEYHSESFVIRSD